MSVTPKSRPHPQSKNEYKRREPVSSHTNTQFILRCKPHRPCYPRQQQCRRTPQSPLCRSLSSPPPPSRLRRQASFLAGTRRTGCGTPTRVVHTGTRHTPDASCLTPRSASGLLPLRLAEPPPPQLLSPLRPTSYRSTDSPLGSSRIAATAAADTNMENQNRSSSAPHKK
jgi:hypothetical protein